MKTLRLQELAGIKSKTSSEMLSEAKYKLGDVPIIASSAATRSGRSPVGLLTVSQIIMAYETMAEQIYSCQTYVGRILLSIKGTQKGDGSDGPGLIDFMSDEKQQKVMEKLYNDTSSLVAVLEKARLLTNRIGGDLEESSDVIKQDMEIAKTKAKKQRVDMETALDTHGIHSGEIFKKTNCF